MTAVSLPCVDPPGVRGPGSTGRHLNHTSLAILGALMRAAENGRPVPTYRDLTAIIGVRSICTICCHVNRLKRLGLLTMETGEARTLMPTCRFLYVKGSDL